jgi:hypothetical protein
MTKKTSTPTTQAPAFSVWFVPERAGSPWTRLGALWPTQSGKGYRMTLDFTPVSAGRCFVMPYEPHAMKAGEGA